MGLKISTFKKGGKTFTDVYAKIGSLRYDNDTKTAVFNIKIYPNKTDRNFICELTDHWTATVQDVDMVKQCYDKISTIISQTKIRIANMETETEGITDDDNRKLKALHRLSKMKENEILQLDGAVIF